MSPTKIGEAGDIERAASLVIGIWNRNFAGFNMGGNKDKNGKSVPKNPREMYVEIMKNRQGKSQISKVFGFNGNTGRISEESIESQDSAVPKRII